MNAVALALAACVPVYATRELTARQLCALLLLQDGPAPSSKVGELLGLTRSNTQRLVQGLRKREFLLPATKGSQAVLELSPRGALLLRRAPRFKASADGRVALPIEVLPASPANVQRLRKILARLEQALKAGHSA